MRKARKIAGTFSLPIIGVHHMEAHALVARYLDAFCFQHFNRILSSHFQLSISCPRLTEQELQFPFMALLISGEINSSLHKVVLQISLNFHSHFCMA